MQHFNEVKVPVKIAYKEIERNMIAVLPVAFVNQEDGAGTTDQKARLAQAKVINFLEEKLSNIRPRRVQSGRETNSLLKKAGIKVTDLDEITTEELQRILGVQYLLIGKVDYILQKKIVSNTYDYGKTKKDKNKDEKKYNDSSHSSEKEVTNYDYTVYIDLYDNDVNIYSVNREPFFNLKNSWQDSFEYLLKRMPLYRR